MLSMKANEIVEVDNEMIATGNLEPTKETIYDFTQAKKIGSYPYDTCYKLQGPIILNEISSGRKMTIETTCPGVQLYTGNFLHEGGLPDRSGVCLETQFFPDTPNQSHFPSSLVEPGKSFHSETVYRFGIED